jgi:hypothetical protein
MAEAEGEDFSYWGGQKVRSVNGAFGKRRDRTSEWESQYYKGGLFKYIQ